MYTPDGSYFYRFTIDVPFRYVDGLYVLASNEGKTILSYLPGGEKTDAFDLDAFGRSNPTIDMTGIPSRCSSTAMCQVQVHLVAILVLPSASPHATIVCRLTR